MVNRYYLDTSIWRDFFEDRDEPNFPKTTLAHKLLVRIVTNDDLIIVSDMIVFELESASYTVAEIEKLFHPLKSVLLFVEASEKQVGKARDLATKRTVPKGDALHALIARDQKAILVTYDRDFQKLLDITTPKTPRELI